MWFNGAGESDVFIRFALSSVAFFPRICIDPATIVFIAPGRSIQVMSQHNRKCGYAEGERSEGIFLNIFYATRSSQTRVSRTVLASHVCAFKLANTQIIWVCLLLCLYNTHVIVELCVYNYLNELSTATQTNGRIRICKYKTSFTQHNILWVLIICAIWSRL